MVTHFGFVLRINFNHFYSFSSGYVIDGVIVSFDNFLTNLARYFEIFSHSHLSDKIITPLLTTNQVSKVFLFPPLFSVSVDLFPLAPYLLTIFF